VSRHRAAALTGLLLVAVTLLPVPSLARSRAQAERRPAPTVLRAVDVFEAESARVEGPLDVWLSADGTIEALTPPGERQPIEGTREVAAHGHTLLPGLVDVHTHLMLNGQARGGARLPDLQLNVTSLVAAGITATLNMGDWTWLVRRAQRAVTSGRWAGPEIYGLAEPVTVPGGHPAALLKEAVDPPLHPFVDRRLVDLLRGPEDVDRILSERQALGSDTVKVVLDDMPVGAPQMSREVLTALVDEAHRRGMRVIAHVGEPEDVELALAAGIDALVHVPCRGRIGEATLTALVERQIPIMSTVHVWHRSVELADRTVRFSELERLLALPSALAPLERDGGIAELPAYMEQTTAALRGGLPDLRANLVELHERGARLLIGSDTANIGTFTGTGFHNELDLLADLGLTPAWILRAATWSNARWLDPDASPPFGAVRPGWQADLLLVEGDPTTDLSVVHRPRAVWIDGRRVRLRGAPWSQLP
jgi:imidazolonepropionase-like amidohydrolase